MREYLTKEFKRELWEVYQNNGGDDGRQVRLGVDGSARAGVPLSVLRDHVEAMNLVREGSGWNSPETVPEAHFPTQADIVMKGDREPIFYAGVQRRSKKKRGEWRKA